MKRGIIIYNTEEDKLTPHSNYSVWRLLQAGRARNIPMIILPPNKCDLIVSQHNKNSILFDGAPMVLPDFVLTRTGSPTTYYALSIIRQLEYLGCYVCNNAEGVLGVKDKLYMHQKLALSKLPTPKTMLAKFPLNEELVESIIGFPLVIKNITGTQGEGIYLCKNRESFRNIMELIYSYNPNANIILQEFIHNSFGRDLRVFVVGGKVIGCIERTSVRGFKANYSKGGHVKVFKVTPEIEKLALEATKLLGLEIAGVDLLFDNEGFKVCEANSSPGFQGLEEAIGQHVAETILDYILDKTEALQARRS